MPTTIAVEFNGAVFIPREPVHLPAGTKAAVILAPPAGGPFAAPPPPMPAAQRAEWESFLAAARAAIPSTETVDDAMREIRGRP
jgi:hypothetical protein